MYTQVFTPPAVACAAAVFPASTRPPPSAEELWRPGDIAKALSCWESVVQKHGLTWESVVQEHGLACAAALFPASARPPPSAEELWRPGGMAKALSYWESVVQEHGLDSVESDEDAVVDVLYGYYMRHQPEYGNDARMQGDLRSFIQGKITDLKRLSRAELNPAERDNVAQDTSMFA